MARYNYIEAMKQDIRDYLENDFSENIADYDREELEEKLEDDLWINDSVTGNASGSYTFCRQTAKEYVLDNTDLLLDMINAFCIDAEQVGKHFISEDWEWFDVSIRCYCLSEAIGNVLDEMGV